MGETAALPAALEEVEDLEVEFGHGVVGHCLDAIPDHCVGLFECSGFFGGQWFEVLRLSDGWSYASRIVSHCVEELELKRKERI